MTTRAIQVAPQRTVNHLGAILAKNLAYDEAIPSTIIPQHTIVSITSTSAAYAQVVKADAVTSPDMLWVTAYGMEGFASIVKWANVPFDTSGASIGDPAYLGTAGAIVLTAPVGVIPVVVGRVTAVGPLVLTPDNTGGNIFVDLADGALNRGGTVSAVVPQSFEVVLSPTAIETPVLSLPAGSSVTAVWANVESFLIAGGTSLTWSLGITADVDQYGTATSDDFVTQADGLNKNFKWSAGYVFPASGIAGDAIGLFNPNPVEIVLTAAATGGAVAGDTPFSSGSIRVIIEYRTITPIPDVA